MDAINGKVGMVPVDQGIIKAHPEPFRPERFHVFLHQIPPRGGIGAFVVGVLGIEHAEAFVVLGGEHGVFHARRLGRLGPGVSVIEIGIEMLKIFLVFFLRNALPAFHPFMPGGQGIQSPMNEHAEPGSGEPFRIAGGFADNVAAHMDFPPLVDFLFQQEYNIFRKKMGCIFP